MAKAGAYIKTGNECAVEQVHTIYMVQDANGQNC